ncbi:Peptidase, A24 family [Mesorhizobium loti]|nr:Peptidase, A24 family [Mesorhizobium loti]
MPLVEGLRCSKRKRSRREMYLIVQFMLHVLWDEAVPQSSQLPFAVQLAKNDTVECIHPNQAGPKGLLAQTLYCSASRAA